MAISRGIRILPVRAVALVMAALLLTGCMSMAVESDFNEDGSATHTLAITIDTSAFGDLAGEFDPEQTFEGIEDQALGEGYRAENISEDGVVGVRIIRDVEDTEDLGTILNELFSAGAEGGQEINAFSGTFDKDGDDYRLDLTVDGDALTQGAGAGMGETGTEELDSLGFGIEQILEMSYTVHMPGGADEDATNGTVNADGSITWTLPVSGQETLTARTSTGGGGGTLLLILVAVGAIVLGVIAVAVVGFVFLLSRRAPTPAAASPAAPAAPPPPPATEGAWFAGPDQATRPLPNAPEDDLRPGKPAP